MQLASGRHGPVATVFYPYICFCRCNLCIDSGVGGGLLNQCSPVCRMAKVTLSGIVGQ